MRYSELKTALHGDVPEDFDPRVGLKTSAEDTMMDALLDALRDLQYTEQENERGTGENEGNAATDAQTAQLLLSRCSCLGISTHSATRMLRDGSAGRTKSQAKD